MSSSAPMPASPCKPCSSRGDPLGRPRSFMPTNKSRGMESLVTWPRQTNREACLGAVGDSGARARRCLAPTVALGHSCQRARSWLGQTNREAWSLRGGKFRWAGVTPIWASTRISRCVHATFTAFRARFCPQPETNRPCRPRLASHARVGARHASPVSGDAGRRPQFRDHASPLTPMSHVARNLEVMP